MPQQTSHGCICNTFSFFSMVQSELLVIWASLEQDHTVALAGATEALESAILRVPVTGAARVGCVSCPAGHYVDLRICIPFS